MTISRRSFVEARASHSPLSPRRVRLSPLVGVPPIPIRIGLVGCGGRGTGAVRDAVRASDNVQIMALGDLFPDRITSAQTGFARTVTEDPRFAAAYKVTPEKCSPASMRTNKCWRPIVIS